MKLALKQIARDIAFSPREETDKDVVGAYAECFEQLPPIVVFKIPDKPRYFLVDGWHRYAAAERLGLELVEVDAKHGSKEDAQEYALLANLKHGKPLTGKEKRKVIEAFLRLHPGRSNSWLANDLATSRATVDTIRGELEATCQIDTLSELIGRDGKMRPSTIEQPKKPEPESEEAQETIGDTMDDTDNQPTAPVVPMIGPYLLNKAHQVDCLLGLPGLPADSVDLVFTDPPYNRGKDYGSGSKDKWTAPEYLTWCLQWFMQVYRVLKPGGAFYLMQYPEIAAAWKQSLDNLLTFRRWLSWVYPSSIGHSDNNWTRSHRAILYYVKAGAEPWFHGNADPQPYKNPDDRRVRHSGREGTTAYDWWKYNLVKNVSKAKTSWPNQLPVELVHRIVVTSCPSDGIVLDPFIGSGSTAEAAAKAGRAWIGFDLQAKACELANDRGAV